MQCKTEKTGTNYFRMSPSLTGRPPHQSAGFSPFELLYGREVQGPLDLLKKGWEAKPGTSENVVSHVLLMRDQLERMAGVVQQNMRGA